MEKRTIVSGVILCAAIFSLVVLSLLIPGLWANHFSHWSILPAIALFITLLMGLVLMDDLFELNGTLAITLKKLKLKVEIKKFLVLSFLIVCVVAIILELVQFFLSQGNASLLDPITIIGGSVLGIVIHIIGSKLLMKRVEFELERWEDNVL